MSKGRQSVDKLELVWFHRREAVWLGEIELGQLGAVYEDAVDSGRVVVAQRVVFPIKSRGVNAVLVKVLQGVRDSRNDVAEMTVDSPCAHTDGYFNISLYRVTLVGVEVAVVTVLVSLADCAVGAHLIVCLSLYGQNRADE